MNGPFKPGGVVPGGRVAVTLSDGEAEMTAALAPFGWTCGPVFWDKYYNDAWVFNLANAVVALSRPVPLSPPSEAAE